MSATLWSKFYWSDWKSDVRVQSCSLAARGLWMEMLCIAAQHNPIGYVAIDGKALGAKEIARHSGATVEETEKLIKELEDAGVFSRDRTSKIYSRRMINESKRREKGKLDGLKGGNPTLLNQKGKSRTLNYTVNGRDNRGGSPQIPDTRVHMPDADSGGRSLNEKSEALFEAAKGNVAHGTTGIEFIGPILDLEAQGCDFELDILPVVRDRIAKIDTPLRTWGARWLRDAILEHKATRLSNRGKGSGDTDWDNIVRNFKDKGLWVESAWGPKPGERGCQVPPEILKQHDVA